ncbi:alpha/beta hydrolase [Bacillus pumilus]|uniref:alpha/beta fold hydrolase n=1 Tax=Bacillus TaxID=1386 RepID=UPI000D024A6C|nr:MULTISPECIES: alpha/beta hydrolase [Bacillus]AZV54814.1 alpha/beta hydrolase [Bacillus pumilus]MBU5257975.1 alpha/beta hydrolase [Bacillus pumilus]MDF2003071.1 alpha/beta hydrolase [Bacillus pumilus]MDF2023996.1 alpha/beta hydrolase [Bacillus pumilus]MDF2027953.1 alpha/beta hydrolase [Bacillus pumilus]
MGRIHLQDGRHIGLCEYGDLEGFPVFFFHGTPGSRVMFLDDDPISKELGVRLICLDRPGFGLSTPQPDRTILDWAKDVLEVADHLGIHHFSVMGVSGGGAFAAGCAYQLPNRVLSAALISSTTPFQDGKPPKSMLKENKLAFFLSKKFPWLLKASYRSQKKMIEKKPEKFKKLAKNGNKHLHPWDRQFLQTDEQLEMMMMHLHEATRQSVDECIHEPYLLSQPWAFDMKDIQIPVDVWHGKEDTMAPFVEIEKMAPTIPNVKTYYIDQAGHFLTDVDDIWRDILLSLKTRAEKYHQEHA